MSYFVRSAAVSGNQDSISAGKDRKRTSGAAGLTRRFIRSACQEAVSVSLPCHPQLARKHLNSRPCSVLVIENAFSGAAHFGQVVRRDSPTGRATARASTPSDSRPMLGNLYSLQAPLSGTLGKAI